MSKISAWRGNLSYATLIQILTLFELILSVIFLLVSLVTGNSYFRGVGVGLVIAWVTSAIAYFVIKRSKA